MAISSLHWGGAKVLTCLFDTVILFITFVINSKNWLL